MQNIKPISTNGLKDELAQLPGRSFTFRAQIDGKFPEYSYPTDEVLELKRGAQVMFVKILCGMELRRNEKITFRCTELEKDALAEQAARCSLSVSESVSYTHLDVYKRQYRNTAGVCPLGGAQGRGTPRRNGITLVESYTLSVVR